MNRENIIGQSLLLERFEKTLSSRRVVHAYLFVGPKGSGKKTLSSLFAKALLCRSKGEKPCGICNSCIQFSSGNHPDVVTMGLQKDKSGIVVDQIRQMESDIKIKPYQSDYKIYFIEEAHLMNTSAQNALLKTLEEPPPYGIIILLADNIGNLLPTIISRCQQFKICGLSREETASFLERQLPLPRQEALFYAGLSQGIPGKALLLATDESLREIREALLGHITYHKNFDFIELFKLFDKNKDKFNLLLDMLVFWFRDLIFVKLMKGNKHIINSDKISLLNKLHKNFTIDALEDMINIIEDSRKIAGRSGNYKMTIENMLIGLQGGIDKCH